MKYLIKMKDGRVCLMDTTRDDVDPVSCVEKWPKEMKENYISHRLLKDGDLPAAADFRKAWRNFDDVVYVDMDEARKIHIEKLRKLRKPLLDELDVEFMKALESEDSEKKNDVLAKKKELRDITIHPDIGNAKSFEELRMAAISLVKENKNGS